MLLQCINTLAAFIVEPQNSPIYFRGGGGGGGGGEEGGFVTAANPMCGGKEKVSYREAACCLSELKVWFYW